MKKVLLILLFVIFVGAGIGGTVYFYMQNKNQIEQNTQLMAQNAQVQAQLDQIGQMTEVYEVQGKVFGGNQIKQEDLVPVSIPVSACGDSSVTDMNELIGKYYKIDIKPGTILTKDMLMDEVSAEASRYTRDILLTAVPVTLMVGDYVDIRMMLPNGEDYIVVAHKRVELLYSNTITIKMSEEEQAIWNSAMIDLAVYGESGCILYLTRYLDPGVDTDAVATYPVQHDAENWVKFNPNIQDTTRCINTTLRDHIDEILFVYTSNKNENVTRGISNIFQAHMQAQVAAQMLWEQEFTDPDTEQNTWTDFDTNVENQANKTFQEQVGESMDNLDQGLDELGGIE